MPEQPDELDVATPGREPARWDAAWDEPLTSETDPDYVTGAVTDMTPEQRAEMVAQFGEDTIAELEARERAQEAAQFDAG